MATNLLPFAVEGYEDGKTAAKVPHLAWSPAWMAYQVGAWMERTGRSKPRACTASRGYRIRCNDMLLELQQVGDGPLHIERRE